jgi:GNAT superfamily N-acetyltransferase
MIGLVCLLGLILWLYHANTTTCQHATYLQPYERHIISAYIKDEYSSAADYLDDPDATHFYIIDDGRLVSYFHIILNREGNYYINYVYTNKKDRGKGFMKKLLQYALSIMGDRTLYTWTKNTNQASQSLFLSSGFTIFSRDEEDVVLRRI